MTSRASTVRPHLLDGLGELVATGSGHVRCVGVNQPGHCGATEHPCPRWQAGQRTTQGRSRSPEEGHRHPTHESSQPQWACLRLCASESIPIIEDNTLELLGQGSPPTRSIASMSGPATVLAIGSLSKAAWGGLRIGWIRSQPDLIERIVRAKTVLDIGSPILNQHVAVSVVDALDELSAEMTVRVRTAHDAAYRAFEELLPSWSCPLPAGGLCSWVTAPGVDTTRLSQVAQRYGVIITAGSVFSPEGTKTDRFRLPLVFAAETMTAAIKRIASAAETL